MPTRARVAGHDHRRRAPARRRHGHGRLRRADHPVRDHRPAHRAAARLGRHLRAASSSASACLGWPSSASCVGFVGVAILVGPTAQRRDRGARSARAGGDHRLAHRLVDSARCIASHRAALPRDPLVATGAQMVAGRRRPDSGWPLLAGELGPVRPGGGLDRLARGLRLPHRRRQPARVHRLRLAPARRAAAARRDVRLRQPGRRGHPRGARPAGADRRPDRSSPAAVIIGAVALIVTARGRMQAPVRGRRQRPTPRSALRQDRPRHPPSQRHHGQHRIDPERRSGTARCPRRTGRRRPRSSPAVATDTTARIAGVVGRVGAHPGRAHLVGGEHGCPVRPESNLLSDPPRKRSNARRRPVRHPAPGPDPADGVAATDDLQGTRGPGQPRAVRTTAWRSVATPIGIEAVVEPDAAGAGRASPDPRRRRG